MINTQNVIFWQHHGAICEKVKNLSHTVYKFNLPSYIPQCNSIYLPHAATRATPYGLNKSHTYFYANKISLEGQRYHEENSNTLSNICHNYFEINPLLFEINPEVSCWYHQCHPRTETSGSRSGVLFTVEIKSKNCNLMLKLITFITWGMPAKVEMNLPTSMNRIYI